MQLDVYTIKRDRKVNKYVFTKSRPLINTFIFYYHMFNKEGN